MKKKIGIATVHTGFNYGSCLQAYASQIFISSMGYDTKLLWYKEGMVKGRDVRLKKIIVMVMRTFWRPNLLKKTFLTYKSSLKKEIDNDTKRKFLQFQKNNLKVKRCSWKEMKIFASDKNTLACVCGSDQIWNATNIYIDPIFYLRFAPKFKRVAYAPSFGKNFVPDYNKKIISKYIKDFNHISVREEQGTKIIYDLIGKEVSSVLDPTLVLNKEQWLCSINKIKLPKDYVLIYFLDKPTKAALLYIREITNRLKVPIIAIPYKYDELNIFEDLSYMSAGPVEFINLISNAKFVFTDSFHGTAFSVNFNTPFYIFQRNYGTAADQSSRILSLLERINLKERFILQIDDKNIDLDEIRIDIEFDESNKLLNLEREKSLNYIKYAFGDIENNKK